MRLPAPIFIAATLLSGCVVQGPKQIADLPITPQRSAQAASARAVPILVQTLADDRPDEGKLIPAFPFWISGKGWRPDKGLVLGATGDLSEDFPVLLARELREAGLGSSETTASAATHDANPRSYPVHIQGRMVESSTYFGGCVVPGTFIGTVGIPWGGLAMRMEIELKTVDGRNGDVLGEHRYVYEEKKPVGWYYNVPAITFPKLFTRAMEQIVGQALDDIAADVARR